MHGDVLNLWRSIDEESCMSSEDSNWSEKRRYERYSVKLDVLLKVLIALKDGSKISREFMSIKALGQTNNISIGGLSLKLTASAMEDRKTIPPAYIRLMAGRPIEIEIYGKDLVVWGDVLRSNGDTCELGVIITKVSNVKRWKSLCSEHQEGISIFPDSVQVRRKRRSGG